MFYGIGTTISTESKLASTSPCPATCVHVSGHRSSRSRDNWSERTMVAVAANGAAHPYVHRPGSVDGGCTTPRAGAPHRRMANSTMTIEILSTIQELHMCGCHSVSSNRTRRRQPWVSEQAIHKSVQEHTPTFAGQRSACCRRCRTCSTWLLCAALGVVLQTSGGQMDLRYHRNTQNVASQVARGSHKAVVLTGPPALQRVTSTRAGRYYRMPMATRTLHTQIQPCKPKPNNVPLAMNDHKLQRNSQPAAKPANKHGTQNPSTPPPNPPPPPTGTHQPATTPHAHDTTNTHKINTATPRRWRPSARRGRRARHAGRTHRAQHKPPAEAPGGAAGAWHRTHFCKTGAGRYAQGDSPAACVRISAGGFSLARRRARHTSCSALLEHTAVGQAHHCRVTPLCPGTAAATLLKCS